MVVGHGRGSLFGTNRVAVAPKSGKTEHMIGQHAHTNAGVTAAVLLAGGAATRFGGDCHKLDADLGDGGTVGRRCVEIALEAGIGPLVVVTGAHRLEGLDTILADAAGRVVEVVNPDWSTGQITSLRTGIEYADRHGAEAVVVGLADQPAVSIEAWRAIARSPSPIAVATYAGERGHPVRLHRSVWHLLPSSGDEGARRLFHLRPDLVEAIACVGSSVDIDTLEDLNRWQRN